MTFGGDFRFTFPGLIQISQIEILAGQSCVLCWNPTTLTKTKKSRALLLLLAQETHCADATVGCGGDNAEEEGDCDQSGGDEKGGESDCGSKRFEDWQCSTKAYKYDMGVEAIPYGEGGAFMPIIRLLVSVCVDVFRLFDCCNTCVRPQVRSGCRVDSPWFPSAPQANLVFK